MIGYIQEFASAMWAPKTDRGVIARLMALPLLEGLASILFAVIAVHAGWIGHGVQPTGVLRFVMILVALGVFWLSACGLWHLLGVLWFLWATRQVKRQEHAYLTPFLLSCMWKIPLVSAAFCWIPLLVRTTMIPGNVPRWALAIGMIVVQLIVTYVWVAVARGLLRLKHGI